MGMASERPIQTPCGWCGKAVPQPETGRLLRYCNRSCRQRAYEIRAASRRLQEDLEAGRVQRAPVETVRRAPRPAYPNTVDGWLRMLATLTEHLRSARFLNAGDRENIERALQEALRHAPSPLRRAGVTSPAAVVPQQRVDVDTASLDDDLWDEDLVAAYEPGAAYYSAMAGAALAEYLPTVAGRRTTLTELAAALGADVAATRTALRQAVMVGDAQIRRDGAPVDVDALPVDTRFRISGR